MIGPFRTPTDILLWQFCKAYTAWCEWKIYNIEFANWISNQKICNCEFCTTYNHWLAPFYNLFTKQSSVAGQMNYNTNLHRVGCEPDHVSVEIHRNKDKTKLLLISGSHICQFMTSIPTLRTPSKTPHNSPKGLKQIQKYTKPYPTKIWRKTRHRPPLIIQYSSDSPEYFQWKYQKRKQKRGSKLEKQWKLTSLWNVFH